MTAAYAEYLEKLNDLTKIKRAIDDIISFRALIPTQYRNVTDPVFKQSLDKVAKAKGYQYVLDSSTGSGVLLADGPDLLADVKKELGF